jgi:predicted dehydrogenase
VRKLRVGVIGCGLIAQVMHLHYLRELSERFEIAAVCDLSPEVRDAVALQYAVPGRFESWQELITQPLDAVLILTSGSHAPAAIEAAKAGLHVLVEKPMCFSVAEGRAMIDAAEASGVTLMVAYNKRYDHAYLRLAAEARSLEDLRLVRITTLESPLEPYVAHYPLRRGGRLAPGVAEALARDNQERITAAIGQADPLSRWAYHLVLLDSVVHELNAMRGVLGEPDRLEFADVRETGLTAIFTYGQAQCILAWVDLPGIARYEMELAFYSPERRLILSFPSPFLRSAPTNLITEAGTPTLPSSSRTEEITSFEESFKQELIHFHECATTGRSPVTSGADSLRDVALCEAVVAVHRDRMPRERPSEPAVTAAR